MKLNAARTLKWFSGFLVMMALAYFGLNFVSNDIKGTSDERIDAETLEANNPEQREIKKKLLALQEEKGRPLKEEEALSALPEKLAKYISFGTNLNRQVINFHGRVIDQDGNPVKKAQVFASLGASGLSGGSQMYQWTDDEGYFSFEDIEGYRLIVYHIKHSETAPMMKATLDEQSGMTHINKGGRRFHGFQPNTAADELLWTDYKTKETAYEFKVWRYEGGPEVKWRGHNFSCYKEESPYYINILNSKRGVSHLEWSEADKAHLKVSCDVDQIPEGGNQYSQKPRHWWVEIEALEGAFQEIGLDDLHMNKAPLSGYDQTVYRVERVPGTEGYTAKHTVRFYYKSDVYGALYFDLSGLFPNRHSDISNPVFIKLKTKINPEGGRLLEIRK